MSTTERFIRRIKEKLGRAHVAIFIGGVDWSLNESKEKKHKPYWCSHVHGLTVTNDAKALKGALKEQFPSIEDHSPADQSRGLGRRACGPTLSDEAKAETRPSDQHRQRKTVQQEDGPAS